MAIPDDGILPPAIEATAVEPPHDEAIAPVDPPQASDPEIPGELAPHIEPPADPLGPQADEVNDQTYDLPEGADQDPTDLIEPESWSGSEHDYSAEGDCRRPAMYISLRYIHCRAATPYYIE